MESKNNDICKQHSGISQMVKDNKRDNQLQWKEIDRIKNRPPVWCTLVMMVMSGLMGSILTYAALIGKFSQAASAAP